MVEASIETTLELWASSLRDVKARIRPLVYFRSELRHRRVSFWMVFLGNEPRKTGWMRAEAAGDPGPWRQQAILGRGSGMRMRCAILCAITRWKRLADETRFSSLMKPAFLKQGKASCGVARQYTGSAGKITNCQIGVFASYVSRHGHAFIDRALYLPKDWTDDPQAPEGGACAGRCGFCNQAPNRARMIARAIAARCRLPLLRRTVCMAREISRLCFAKPAKAMFWALPPIMCSTPGARSSLSAAPRPRSRKIFPRALGGACRQAKEPKARACTTGPISNWPISMPANTTAALTGEWTRGLLIRRNIADGDLAFFSTWCPKGTPMKKLVLVEGHRWAIEDSFETAKNELGLDHNESRSWHGWHRHVSLVMLAFAMMAAIRHHANAAPPKKTLPRLRDGTSFLIRWSIQEIRRIAMKLAQRRIQPAHIIAWSLWRRAHQAACARSRATSNEKRNCNARTYLKIA